MKRHLTMFFMACILAAPGVAAACECVDRTGPILRVDDKGIVATGRVVNVRFNDETYILAADLEISEGFLNATAWTRITVYTNELSSCHYPLRLGEEYLIVTEYVESADSRWRNIKPGSQSVGLCGGTMVLDSPGGWKMLEAIREERRRR